MVSLRTRGGTEVREVRLWISDKALRGRVDACLGEEVGTTTSEAATANAVVLPPEQCDVDVLKLLADGALVQLTTSGIDALPPGARLRADLTWASAKDAFAGPVAEHVLMLILASLRDVKRDARASSWGPSHGKSLFGRRVTVVGGGAIARSLARLLQPFEVLLTVVRAGGGAVPFAERTTRDLLGGLAKAEVVVLALPLTDATRNLLNASVLSHLAPSTVIVNVSRGAIIDTDALVSALDAGRLGFAALDVVEPEPLPTDHPLWNHPRALVTPHTANPPLVAQERLVELVVDNVRRWAFGERLRNPFNPLKGY